MTVSIVNVKLRELYLGVEMALFDGDYYPAIRLTTSGPVKSRGNTRSEGSLVHGITIVDLSIGRLNRFRRQYLCGTKGSKSGRLGGFDLEIDCTVCLEKIKNYKLTKSTVRNDDAISLR